MKLSTRIINVRNYKIGSQYPLKKDTITELLPLLHQEQCRVTAPLGGRNAILSAALPEIGPVVIKSYYRGGLMKKFNKKWYLRLGMPRSQMEFQFLRTARLAGVMTPTPLAFVFRGFPFYNAWLITKKIKAARTLADIAGGDTVRTKKVLPAISRNIQMLIHNRIRHVDLHPGNIIIDENDLPYIIDFDKACHFSGTIEKLTTLYHKRWARAVKNHNLPEMMLDIG